MTELERRERRRPTSGPKPGYRVFVAEHGAVCFDIPQAWVVVPGGGPVKICDRLPPDDTCAIQLSIFRLPAGIDWSLLPLAQMLADATDGIDPDEAQPVLGRGEVVSIVRDDLEIAWRETRYRDERERREAISRSCIARGGNLQPLITFDFWVDDAPYRYAVWDELVRSLHLGGDLSDLTQGPVMN